MNRSGTHVVSSVYATGLHSRDNTVRDEMLLFMVFCSHDYAYIHLLDI